MNRQIIIAFTTEGSTDVRFLESVIQRSFEDVAFDCTGEIEIMPVQSISKDDIDISNGDFVEMIRLYAQEAEKIGATFLCIHADADSATDVDTFNYKINPAFTEIMNAEDDMVLCKNLIAIVPVQMVEAWMLSDTELLKDEIGTEMSDRELGLYRAPESYADPKKVIEEAIRIARQTFTKRRRRDLKISELYSTIGQKTPLSNLESLPSYQKFKEAVRDAFRKENYLV